MESLDDIYLDAEEKMDKSLQFLRQEYLGIRSGKASPAMVENVTVEYYGTATRLREMANISTPEPRLIVINPFDPTSLAAIEKGIHAANLGMNPMNDGRVIRLPVPELSGERRKELVKLANRLAEEQRIAIRNVRRDANEHVKALEKNGKISQDERGSALDEIQKTTDGYISKIDAMFADKEKEISII